MDVAYIATDPDWLAALQCGLRLLDQLVIHRAVEVMILLFAVVDRYTLALRHLVQDAAEIDTSRLPVLDRLLHVELADLPHHLVEAAEAKLRHQLAHFFSDEEEEVDHMLWLAGELPTQHRILRGNTNRAGVEMAFAHHNAASGDQRCRREAELIGPQQRADHHVAPGAQTTIDLHRDPPTQAV